MGAVANESGRALVLGVNGQDGSILAEQLIALGWHVCGVGRQPESRYVRANERFRYHQADLRFPASLRSLLEAYRPSRVFHLAAVHGSAGYEYEPIWQEAVAVNTLSLHTILEYARTTDPSLRIGYASSAKVFGHVLKGRLSRESPRHSMCLYSITKNASDDLCRHYANVHNIRASVAYFFNHESERRAECYFIPRVCRALARAKRDASYVEHVRTLDFYCDWGVADDYMDWFRRLLELDESDRMIFATGRVLYGKNFVHDLFARHGLDSSNHIKEVLSGAVADGFEVDVQYTFSKLKVDTSRSIFTVTDAIINNYLNHKVIA